MTAEDNTRNNGAEAAPRHRLKRRKRVVRLDPQRLAEAAAELRKTRSKTGPRRTTSHLRVLIWAVQIAVALAVLEHFIIRPFIGRGEKKAMRSTTLKAVRPPEPVSAPLLGQAALSMKGVREAEDARLANLVGLANGSLAMQQAQLTSSTDYSLPVEIVNSIGMRLRLVPPGLVVLGSPEKEPGRGAIERQHVRVILHPFYLGKHEVTQAQYKRVRGLNPSHFRVEGAERPVEEITWYDAQRFLKELCRLEDVPIGTYRLPTEAEWEYACRAGTTTAFHFGDDPARLGEYADTAENNYEGTVPVGRRLPNALGLYNMHGNVWEWCQNRFKFYKGDPSAPSDKNRWYCIRGGNWYVAAAESRSANRCRLAATSHGNMLGFRVLRAIPEFQPKRKKGREREAPGEEETEQ